MDKNFLDFIFTGNSSSFSEKNSINYKKILDSIPFPVSLWKNIGDDSFLIYLNKIAAVNNNGLYPGILLSTALPEEYKKYFTGLFNKSINNFTSLIEIDEDLLLHINYPAKENFNSKKNYHPETFKTIVEQSPVSIIITDIDGTIEYVNPAFINITGYSFNEVVGKNPKILRSGEKTREEYKDLWNTILSGKIWKGEFINKRKNGEVYYEFAVISPIKNNSGKIKKFIAIKEDITKLKKADQELKKYEKLAALGKMATYISHEIKTPLSSIKINVDLLEKKITDDNSKKSLTLIQKEIKRLSYLLKNILQYSNQSNLSFSEVDIYNKIESIKELLNPALKEKGISIINKTLNHKVWGNQQLLRSLFLNMIENSIESIEKTGEIEISSEAKGDSCFIYFKDNGCGIQQKENIFEPFFTTKSTGTGLGLPIIKNIVSNHNGSIKLLSSKPGETIFEIVLQMKGEKNGKTFNN